MSCLISICVKKKRVISTHYTVLMKYIRWYDNLSSHFRDEMAVTAINLLDKALVYIIAGIYVFLIVFLFFTHDPALVRFIVVPAITFVVVTVLRSWLDYPRPYDLYDIDPIIVKATKGKSMPSRHVASAVAIACAIAYVHLDWGALAFTACAIVAFTRIVGGVHFPRDVVAAVVIAAAIGVIGFVLIP